MTGAGGGFSLFGGREGKWQNAAGRFGQSSGQEQKLIAKDLYTQAANAFRMTKQNKEAGQAFEKCASIQTNKLSEP